MKTTFQDPNTGASIDTTVSGPLPSKATIGRKHKKKKSTTDPGKGHHHHHHHHMLRIVFFS